MSRRQDILDWIGWVLDNCEPGRFPRMLPITPFRVWLEERRVEWGTTGLATVCGVSERRLLNWRTGNKTVPFELADQALIREGSASLNDLWPWLDEMLEEAA